MFSLVDCNNFYVSCERAFNPKLMGKPVVVLSNNDGCIVARSNEVKALGIPMGAPYFKHKEMLEKNGVTVFSSNYSLYGDMSQRVMTILRQFSPEMEIYSIDEAFLDFTGFNQKMIIQICKNIRQTILQCTGIPVSIGIGKTKTLAKVANELAKKDSKNLDLLDGVMDLSTVGIDQILKIFPVQDIWGIGRKYSKLLKENNIYTAYEFIKKDDDWVKNKMSIVGLRTKKELLGISCLEIESVAEGKKGIAVTRSFGKSVMDIESLKQAVASYASRGGEKLRKQSLAATYIYVFVMTNRFKPNYYYNSYGMQIPMQTNFTPNLIKYSHHCLEKIFKSGLEYKKAGIFLSGLVPANQIQLDLYDTHASEKLDKQDKIMETIDNINRRYGSNTIKSSAIGTDQPWQMLSTMRSKKYTTSWSELLEISL